MIYMMCMLYIMHIYIYTYIMPSTELDSTLSFSKELFITSNEPGSKLVVLGMAIPPLIGNPYNGAL